MKFEEAKEKFIQTWGTMATDWGINRTMSQVHALLLISPDPLSTDDVMEQLQISRGNANGNLRDLIGWGLIERVFKTGERKEFFVAEKDIWKVACTVARERKKRELEPLIKSLTEMAQPEGDKKDKSLQSFNEMVNSIISISKRTEKILDVVVGSDESKFFNLFGKVIK